MSGKIFLAFLTLQLGVFCSPTPQSLSPATAALQALSKRVVPQCGPSTGIKCGMNVCCSGSSFCGTTVDHCAAGSCQAAYGSCQIPQPKKCGTGSGTTNGRTIGYYRGSNTYSRTCDVVQPSDIDTSKFTHLYYAFAQISSTFQIVPFDSRDVALYSKFTALKNSKLQTWIAIGGANNGTPWSSMVSNANNRAAFIKALKSFMTQYGFQGVDLDWEVPTSQADKEGYVALVKEMKAAYGTSFGMSIAFPVDYGDMFYIDAKGMEPYLNWIGYMSYDIGNPDGSIRAHTDITKIEANALPIWFDGIDPAKLNLGLASYGKGFTIKDASCKTVNCPIKGPGNQGTCIRDPSGVMALFDINDLISKRSLKPALNSTSMVKQLVFDDQWLGYDDSETVALKKGWGNNFCFGGTMQWTTDLGHF